VEQLQVVLFQPLMAVVDLQVAAAPASMSVYPRVACRSVPEILETIILELQAAQAVVLMVALVLLALPAAAAEAAVEL
jgi:hypothetical protein